MDKTVEVYSFRKLSFRTNVGMLGVVLTPLIPVLRKQAGMKENSKEEIKIGHKVRTSLVNKDV